MDAAESGTAPATGSRGIAAGRRVAAAKAGVLDAVVRELAPFLDAAVDPAGIAKRYAYA